MSSYTPTPAQFTDVKKRAAKFVEHYLTDFDHDQRTISKNPDTPFLHIAREHGTALIVFYKADKYPKNGIRVPYMFDGCTATNIELLDAEQATLDFYTQHEKARLIQYFDGSRTAVVNQEKAKQLFHQYKKDLINQFKNQ